jgi:phytoene synthase
MPMAKQTLNKISSEGLELRCSSQHTAFGDDTEKDADNLCFVAQLSNNEAAAWLERAAWVREADRLAENERLDPVTGRFREFVSRRRGAWLDDSSAARAAWARYLDALAAYTCLPFSIETLADHDAMLGRLSGNIFCTFPYLDDDAREAIYAFGALDQFWNNLRDVSEDAMHGVCYFPVLTLAGFGLRQADILDGTAPQRPEWSTLIDYWLGVYLPQLEIRARPFCEMNRLHPSLIALRTNCLERYQRLKAALASPRVLRAARSPAVATGPSEGFNGGARLPKRWCGTSAECRSD